jgi:hypothetical protein
MFGKLISLVEDVVDTGYDSVDSSVSSVVNTVEDFVDSPVETTINIVTQPIADSLDVLEGLSEGELRTVAATRLGVDVVSGLAAGEIINTLLASELAESYFG